MIDIIDIFNNENTDPFLDQWNKKGAYETSTSLEWGVLLKLCNKLKFLEDIDTFKNIDDFINYIQNILQNEADIKLCNQFKGYIFELFATCFLNYFSRIQIFPKNKDMVETYVFKYTCLPPEKLVNDIDVKDYGVDLLCRVTDRSGISKNGVIQVKYRTSKNFDLSSDIISKLFATGIKYGFIEPITKDNNNIKDKTLILFTTEYFDKFKRAFESHPCFENMIIIDGHVINDSINNKDFWEYFKQVLNNIIKYK